MADDFAAQLRSDARAIQARWPVIARGMEAAAEHLQELEGEPAALRAAVRQLHHRTTRDERVTYDHPRHDDWCPNCPQDADYHWDKIIKIPVCASCDVLWPCPTEQALRNATDPQEART